MPWFPDAASVRLVGVNDWYAWAAAYDRADYGRGWSVDIASRARREDLTTAIALSTRDGARLICGSIAGDLRAFDARGTLVAHETTGGGAVRFLATAPVHGEPLIFAACTDRTIRIVDAALRSRGAFETPGSMLAIDAAISSRGAEIVGGAQHDSRVYLWSVEQLLVSGDATPRLVLGGGRLPAYGTRFLPGRDHRWVVHGSWDGRLYLYDLALATSRWLHPVGHMDAGDPLYAVTTFEYQHLPFVMAAGESGTVSAWGLDLPEATPRVHLRFRPLPGAAKSLRPVVIGPDRVLIVLATCRDGSVWPLRPDDPCGRGRASFHWVSSNALIVDVLESR